MDKLTKTKIDVIVGFIIGLIVMIFAPYWTKNIFSFVFGLLLCVMSWIHWIAMKEKLKG